MKYVRKFMKGKRLLQPPALVYPVNNPPTTGDCSWGISGHQFVVGDGQGIAGQRNCRKPEIEAAS